MLFQVVGAACGDRSSTMQDANLSDLDEEYADVVTVEEAVEKLKQAWVGKEVEDSTCIGN